MTQYLRKKFSVTGLNTPAYRDNFDRIFRKEEECKTTTDQLSSDTSPVTPADPETTQGSSTMDTPTASDVENIEEIRKRLRDEEERHAAWLDC